MRSVLVISALLLLVNAACKRDEPPPPPPSPVVVDAAAVAVTPAMASATASAITSAGAATDAGPIDGGSVDAGADAGVDTSKWETRDVNALGTARFAFEGTIRFPKGTKTTASAATISGAGSAGTFAFLDLPDRTQVMLNERSATSVKDGSFEKKLIGETSGGKLIFDRSDATGFFFAFEVRGGGVLVQGAEWVVPPGLGCATRDPITKDKVPLVDAICASLRPKTKK